MINSEFFIVQVRFWYRQNTFCVKNLFIRSSEETPLEAKYHMISGRTREIIKYRKEKLKLAIIII